MMAFKSTPLALAIAASCTLSGCISLGTKPPPSLLTIQATSAVTVGQQQSSATAKTATIAVPTVPQSLATARVPVQSTPTTIAYVKDAVWAELPSRLFARALADTLTARTGRVVLANPQAMSDPGARLSGELRTFGIDAASRQAIVTFDASLTRDNATTVEKRRFEARAPVPAIDAASIGPALNQAANQVAVEVADWVGR